MTGGLPFLPLPHRCWNSQVAGKLADTAPRSQAMRGTCPSTFRSCQLKLLMAGLMLQLCDSGWRCFAAMTGKGGHCVRVSGLFTVLCEKVKNLHLDMDAPVAAPLAYPDPRCTDWCGVTDGLTEFVII